MRLYFLPRWWRRHERRLAPALLLAPAVSLFALFVVYPILRSLLLSLYDWDGVGPRRWVGLANYAELAGDRTFRTALANSLTWLAGYALAPVLGLALALLLSRAAAGMRAVRTLFFMPFVLSQVVVGLVFAWFFHAELGLLNRLLALLGLGPAAPLASEGAAIFTVILAGLWPQTAYCMILYLVGLSLLDAEQIGAARLDGARRLRLLRDHVLPQLRPVSFIVVMVCVVSALRSFDLVAIMTLGGPYDSSTVLAWYMYEQAFVGFRFGYAAAVAVVLFALMWLCVGGFLIRMLRREAA